METCWQPVAERLKFAIIPNTLEVAELWVSRPSPTIARSNPNLAVGGEGRPLPFDAAGNLEQEKLFPHCVRGRRGKN